MTAVVAVAAAVEEDMTAVAAVEAAVAEVMTGTTEAAAMAEMTEEAVVVS